MRNNVFQNFTDLTCYGELDHLCEKNDQSNNARHFIKKKSVEECLNDTVRYELKCQFTELGLGPAPFKYIQGDGLYYGELRIVGDIIRDLLNSNIGLYNLEIEDNVIYSERITF